MYTFIPCTCGSPDCAIIVVKNERSKILDISEANHYVIYPIYYEDYTPYNADKWYRIGLPFRLIKRFFKYLRKLITNNLYINYDIALNKEDVDELLKFDNSIEYEPVNDLRHGLCFITSKVKVDITEIPFFVLLNFLFNGYIAGYFAKYIDRKGVYRPEYSYLRFSIFQR